MDDPRIVRRAEPGREPLEYAPDACRVGGIAGQDIGHRRAADIFDREVIDAVGPVERQRAVLDERIVADPFERARFAAEQRHELVVGGVLRQDDLDRDLLAAREVAAFVDLAHAALRDEADDFEQVVEVHPDEPARSAVDERPARSRRCNGGRRRRWHEGRRRGEYRRLADRGERVGGWLGVGRRASVAMERGKIGRRNHHRPLAAARRRRGHVIFGIAHDAIDTSVASSTEIRTTVTLSGAPFASVSAIMRSAAALTLGRRSRRPMASSGTTLVSPSLQIR